MYKDFRGRNRIPALVFNALSGAHVKKLLRQGVFLRKRLKVNIEYVLNRLNYAKETLEDFIKYTNRSGRESDFALKCVKQAIRELKRADKSGKN